MLFFSASSIIFFGIICITKRWLSLSLFPRSRISVPSLLETFRIFSACVAKVISTITTSCNLNLTVCPKVNMANVFPELHQGKGTLKTPIIVCICPSTDFLHFCQEIPLFLLPLDVNLQYQPVNRRVCIWLPQRNTLRQGHIFILSPISKVL